MVFLSTPSARRATTGIRASAWGCGHFYPRPPRGGRPSVLGTIVGWVSFLSTPSARRATQTGQPSATTSANFYPRPPRGGRLELPEAQPDDVEFLSTPSARRATSPRPSPRRVSKFLSTPSARRATALQSAPGTVPLISIHALREEGDVGLVQQHPCTLHFYPRPPRGGRPCAQLAFAGF